jgi:hypothetical protein
MLLILVVLLSASSGIYAGASYFAQQAPGVTVTTTIFTTTTSWTTSTIWSTVTSVVQGILTTVQYTTSTSTTTVTAGTSTPTTFGSTSTSGMLTYPAAGFILFARYASGSGSGPLSSISVFVTGVSGSATGNVAIYADSSGSPGALLAQGTPQALSNGVNTFSSLSASVSIVGSTNYWLAFEMTGGLFYYSNTGGPGGGGYATCCTMPSTIPVYGSIFPRVYGIYATYSSQQ